MAKSKNKTRSENEHLKGEIRRLRAELKRRQKKKGIEDTDAEIEKEPDPRDICPSCGKGTWRFVDLKHVIYKICELCGFKLKVK
jgi:hypothetical protein